MPFVNGAEHTKRIRKSVLSLEPVFTSKVFSANFAADCVKTPCYTESMSAEFCLVSDKIMLENPHTLLMNTGSYTLLFAVFMLS